VAFVVPSLRVRRDQADSIARRAASDGAGSQPGDSSSATSDSSGAVSDQRLGVLQWAEPLLGLWGLPLLLCYSLGWRWVSMNIKCVRCVYAHVVSESLLPQFRGCVRFPW
jgi:hypothetical protein